MINEIIVKNFLYLLGGTTIAQLITIIASPLLSRVFNAEDFGHFAILTTMVYFIAAFACLRLDFAILSSENKNELIWLTRKAFKILLTLTSVICILDLYLFFYLQSDKILLIFLPALVFFSGLYNISNNICLRLNLNRVNAAGKVLQSGGGVISQLFFGLLGQGFLGMVLGQLAGFFYSLMYIIKNIKFIVNKTLTKNGIDIKLKTYKNYIYYDSIAAGCSVIANHLPTLMISLLLGSNIGGNYFMAYRVLMLPISVISLSLSQYISTKYKLWHHENIYCRNLSKILSIISIMAFVPSILISFFLPNLFEIILGNEWRLGGEIASFCIYWIALKFIFESFIVLLSLNNRQKVALYFQITLIVARTGAIVLGSFLEWENMYIIKIFCTVSAIWYFMGVLLISYFEKLNAISFLANILVGIVIYIIVSFVIKMNFYVELVTIGLFTFIWILIFFRSLYNFKQEIS